MFPCAKSLLKRGLVEAADSFGKSLGVKLGASDIRAQRGGDGGYQLGIRGSVLPGALQLSQCSRLPAGKLELTLAGNSSRYQLPHCGANLLLRACLSVFNTAANRFLIWKFLRGSRRQDKWCPAHAFVTTDKVLLLLLNRVKVPYSTHL